MGGSGQWKIVEGCDSVFFLEICYNLLVLVFYYISDGKVINKSEVNAHSYFKEIIKKLKNFLKKIFIGRKNFKELKEAIIKYCHYLNTNYANISSFI